MLPSKNSRTLLITFATIGHGWRLLLVAACLGHVSIVTAEQDGPPNRLSSQEMKDGWILLFDGESQYGWKAASDANWRVAEGAIVVDEGEPGLLHTTTQFADYVLKVDFQMSPLTNSGVFLRTSPRPTDPSRDCYELNLAGPDNPFPTGSLVDRKKAQEVATVAGWQTYEISAEGGVVRVKLNNQLVLDHQDENGPGRGFIGLQRNSGAVKFRNIKLRPLGLEPLLNGRDLTGWKTDQAQESRFTVTSEGALNIKNGKGQLESERQFADFVLQTEIFCNGKELNSGIFFRCIPGDFWMGYESQIHNGYRQTDRSQPSNGGTGGIFRRQEARRVVANDFEWFHKTIVAEGNHLAVWVNGLQVSDWTDRRPPNANPRRGLRRDAGTIILQGHDPTTDLSFRDFRAAEMASR